MDADTADEWRALILGVAQKCREVGVFLVSSARLRRPWRCRPEGSSEMRAVEQLPDATGFLLRVIGRAGWHVMRYVCGANKMRSREVVVVVVAVAIVMLSRRGGAVVSCVFAAARVVMMVVSTGCRLVDGALSPVVGEARPSVVASSRM